MFWSFLISALLPAAVSAYAKSGADHPTLPEMWKATTIEPTVGKGTEAYNFVAVPTADNLRCGLSILAANVLFMSLVIVESAICWDVTLWIAAGKTRTEIR